MGILLSALFVSPATLASAISVAAVEQTASPGDAPLPEYPGLPHRATVRPAAVVTTPTPCADNGSDMIVTRSQILARAYSWLDVGGVPYSQDRCYSNSHGDYRTDCSGFVSMAWGLGGPGSSFWTGNLDNRSFQIPRNSLMPGDALLRHTGNPDENHVALFVRWANSDSTQPVVIQQTGSSGTIESTWSASYAGLYTPMRYNNVRDDRSSPILARDLGSSTIVLYRWNSTGSSFSGLSTATYYSFDLGKVGERVASGDVNGDGKDDTVMAYANSDGTFTFKVFLNGTVTPANWYTSGPFSLEATVGNRLIVGDFNGDGKDEPILARDFGSSTIVLYRWYSTGSSFSGLSTATYYSFDLGKVGERVASGDVNSDGKDDTVMAYANSDGTFTFKVFLNGTVTPANWYTSGPFSLEATVGNRLIVGDFNGDGKDEPILARDFGSSTIVLYRWYSTGSSFSGLSTATYYSFDLGKVGERVASGDVNSDGKDDTVMAYANSDGTFTFKVFLNGTITPANWYTSGPFSLEATVGNRLIVGSWF
ncbi:FG-GAP repeat domain-containing protein [Micromonospora rifamycinica]|nr:VCBS repeat-containing protein [Micromonospora rifamycinica]